MAQQMVLKVCKIFGLGCMYFPISHRPSLAQVQEHFLGDFLILRAARPIAAGEVQQLLMPWHIPWLGTSLAGKIIEPAMFEYQRVQRVQRVISVWTGVVDVVLGSEKGTCARNV